MVSADVKSIYFCIFSKVFLYFKRPGLLLESIQPTIWCDLAFIPGVKRPEREANHLPPFRAGVKNESSYTCARFVYLQDVNSENFVIYIFLKVDDAAVIDLCYYTV